MEKREKVRVVMEYKASPASPHSREPVAVKQWFVSVVTIVFLVLVAAVVVGGVVVAIVAN